MFCQKIHKQWKWIFQIMLQNLQKNEYVNSRVAHPFFLKSGAYLPDLLEFDRAHYKKTFHNEYQILNEHIIPGAVYIEMLAAIGFSFCHLPILRITSFEVGQIALWSQMHSNTFVITPSNDNQHWEFYTREKKGWALNRRFGMQNLEVFPSEQSFFTLNQFNTWQSIDFSSDYKNLQDLGISFGPNLQLVKKLQYCSNIGYAHIEYGQLSDLNDYEYHPCIIYSAFQAMTFFLAHYAATENENTYIYLPKGLRAITMKYTEFPLSQVWISMQPTGDAMDIILIDSQGTEILMMQAFGLLKIEPNLFMKKLDLHNQKLIQNTYEKNITIKLLDCLESLEYIKHEVDAARVLHEAIIFLWAMKMVSMEPFS